MTGRTLRRTGRNYPQQLYFALHVHAAWFLLLAIGAAVAYLPARLGGVGLLVPVWMFIYLVLALRRA